jgi:hypothetical protein
MAWQTPKTNWGQPGQTVPGADDFNRIEGNIETLGKYDRAPGYGTATGTNAKSITLNPAPGSYYDGLCFAFKNATQNTGAVTINVNGMGAKPIKKPNGNDLVAGNLKAGIVYTVRYNGTNFILQGSDSTGNARPEHVLAGKTFSNDDGPDQVGTLKPFARESGTVSIQYVRKEFTPSSITVSDLPFAPETIVIEMLNDYWFDVALGHFVRADLYFGPGSTVKSIRHSPVRILTISVSRGPDGFTMSFSASAAYTDDERTLNLRWTAMSY